MKLHWDDSHTLEQIFLADCLEEVGIVVSALYLYGRAQKAVRKNGTIASTRHHEKEFNFLQAQTVKLTTEKVRVIRTNPTQWSGLFKSIWELE